MAAHSIFTYRWLTKLVLVSIISLLLVDGSFADQKSRYQENLQRCHRQVELAEEMPGVVDVARAERCVMRMSRALGELGHTQVPWLAERVQLWLDMLTHGSGAPRRAMVQAAKSAPTQEDWDQIVGSILGDGFEGEDCTTSCEALIGSLESGTTSCADGGNLKLTVKNCSAKGKTNLGLNFKNCVSDGEVLKGKSNMIFTVSASQTKIKLKNKKPSTLEGFKVKSKKGVTATSQCVNGKNSALTCKGKAKSGKSKCSMSSDCSQCAVTGAG